MCIDDPAVGRGGELDHLVVLVGAEPADREHGGAAAGLRDGQLDLLDRLARDLEDLADLQALQRREAERLAVQHRVDPHRRVGGGAAHQRLPEVVRPVARRLDVARLDRGADHVERRERQDQHEAAAPAGLAEGQLHAEHHHVDVVGGEAELRQVLALVADASAPWSAAGRGWRRSHGRRPARMASRCSRQSAMSMAVKGRATGSRRLHRVAAERQVDRGGRRGRTRSRCSARGVGVLDVDERRASPGAVIFAGGVGELGDTRGADRGADQRLDQRPQPVLDAAGEGLAEQVGVGERRAGDAAVPELLRQDVGGGGIGGLSMRAGDAQSRTQWLPKSERVPRNSSRNPCRGAARRGNRGFSFAGYLAAGNRGARGMDRKARATSSSSSARRWSPAATTAARGRSPTPTS